MFKNDKSFKWLFCVFLNLKFVECFCRTLLYFGILLNHPHRLFAMLTHANVYVFHNRFICVMLRFESYPYSWLYEVSWWYTVRIRVYCIFKQSLNKGDNKCSRDSLTVVGNSLPLPRDSAKITDILCGGEPDPGF